MIYFIGAYLLLQMAIGYWVSKKVKNATDFFLAGKQLSLPLVSVSLVATWFGAETCIGSAGAVYAHGLSGSRADPFGYSLCLLFMGFFIAVPMWKGNYITIGDMFARRFGWSTEKLTVLILIPGSLIWGGAQIRAFGQIISSSTELPVDITMLICTIFIVFYTFLGGLLGDMITDFIQGLLVITGLIVLLVTVVYSSDFSFAQWWTHVSPERLSFVAIHESPWQRMDRWAIPILGSLITQELISRTLSAKSPEVARNSSFAACGMYLFAGSIPVILGLIGPELLPHITDQEQFLPELAQKYLHQSTYIIFVGALISALLSTIDSILLSVSAMASQNVFVKYLKHRTKKEELILARFLVIMAALISYMIAISSSGIYSLVEIASSFGTAGLLVAALIGLWSRWGGLWAANFCILTGAIVYPLGSYAKIPAPFLTAVFAALCSYFLGILAEKRFKWS
ncbi:MAG: sodium:solute symporter family protein [Bdellovibrionaceae bacterium]|nr:sodium:solute symporter family protein [Pseudobdellovibrionaceae bacterium]